MHMKQKTLTIAAASTLLLGLSACGTGNYEELAQTKAESGSFSKALTAEYKKFAKSEINQYDWPDQQLIAKKGLAAAKGRQPLPEDPANWRISHNDRKPLYQTRADLIQWLNTDARQLHPKRAARAQRNFDCWVEQKEENWQLDDIKACRDGTRSNLPAIAQIYFKFDSANLEPSALVRLAAIAKDWVDTPGTYLLVQGYADKTGNPVYNYRLSRKRAVRAGHFLRKFGVPEAKIRYQVWGESRPRASSQKANILQPSELNRRVEILKF